jgi:hypothetical protein
LKYVGNQYKTPLILITSKSLGYKKTVGVDDREILIKNIPVGIHDLTLRLLNKEEQDTVVSDNGQIIDDLYAVIESLQIDNYDFMHKIDLISNYHDNHGNEIQTYGWLSFPQDFRLWFQTPGWYFARNLSVIPVEKIKYYLNADTIQ